MSFGSKTNRGFELASRFRWVGYRREGKSRRGFERGLTNVLWNTLVNSQARVCQAPRMLEYQRTSIDILRRHFSFLDLTMT
jgi:hypothetical protein